MLIEEVLYRIDLCNKNLKVCFGKQLLLYTHCKLNMQGLYVSSLLR